MPKKSTSITKYIPPTMLMLVAVVLMYLSTINFCVGCTGWSALNPMCQLGYVSCIGSLGIVHWVMRIGAVVLFVVAIVKMVKIK